MDFRDTRTFVHSLISVGLPNMGMGPWSLLPYFLTCRTVIPFYMGVLQNIVGIWVRPLFLGPVGSNSLNRAVSVYCTERIVNNNNDDNNNQRQCL